MLKKYGVYTLTNRENRGINLSGEITMKGEIRMTSVQSVRGAVLFCGGRVSFLFDCVSVFR